MKTCDLRYHHCDKNVLTHARQYAAVRGSTRLVELDVASSRRRTWETKPVLYWSHVAEFDFSIFGCPKFWNQPRRVFDRSKKLHSDFRSKNHEEAPSIEGGRERISYPSVKRAVASSSEFAACGARCQKIDISSFYSRWSALSYVILLHFRRIFPKLW